MSEGMQTTENTRILSAGRLLLMRRYLRKQMKELERAAEKRMSGHLREGKENGAGIISTKEKRSMTDLHNIFCRGLTDGFPESVHIP